MNRESKLTIPGAEELLKGYRIIDHPEGVEENTLLVGGDLCPVNRTEGFILSGTTEPLWGDLRDTISRSTLSIANLECPLTKTGEPLDKYGPVLSADPACAAWIKQSGWDALALANNHIMDRGVEGLSNTLNACRESGLQTVGAGPTLAEAAKPLILKLGTTTVGMLNLAESEFGMASGNKAGANPLDPITNYHHIQSLKKQVELVVVMLHGGNEGYHLPRPGLVQTCRFLVDMGAHAVICSHTHAASGLEIYHSAPIIYGTGNLLFDWPHAVDKQWSEGYLVQFVVGHKAITSLKLFPYRQYSPAPGLLHLKAEEALRFAERISSLSEVIVNPVQLEQQWNEFCSRKRDLYMRWLRYGSGPKGRVNAALVKLLSKPLEADHLRIVTNLIRCEAHRDALLNILTLEHPPS